MSDHGGDVAKAYAPYGIIIVIFALANLAPVKAFFAEAPWTVKFPWPGLNVFAPGADEPLASTTFTFNWFAAAGTLMIFAGILTAIVPKVSPARALKAYVDTYKELKWAIVTVMAVLALAYVMNQSGQTTTLGAFLAQTGSFFVFLSPILGWIGVAVTGSDTSANALFGALQVQTAVRPGWTRCCSPPPTPPVASWARWSARRTSRSRRPPWGWPARKASCSARCSAGASCSCCSCA